MVLPSKHNPDAGGNAAQVGVAGVLRDAAPPEDARHFRIVRVACDGYPLPYAKFGATHYDKPRVPLARVLARCREIPGLAVIVRADADARVRNHSRLPGAKTIAAGDFHRRDRDPERDADP